MAGARRHQIVEGVLTVTVACLTASALGCTGESTAPGDDTAALAFQPATLDLAEGRQAQARLENVGAVSVGPIQLIPSSVTTETGGSVAGARLETVPNELANLDPGEGVSVTVTVVLTTTPAPGPYRVALRASSDGDSLSALDLRFDVAPPPPIGTGVSVSISGGQVAPRQGDVVTYTAEVRDSSGGLVTDPNLTWAVTPSTAGLMTADGRFVGYTVDSAGVVASVDNDADTLAIAVVERGVESPAGFTVVGRGVESTRHTSDLWVYGDHAYTGTWSCRSACGDRLIAWNVVDPANPLRVDEIVVDAVVVNDVKVNDAGTLAVITHEGSSDDLNGITLLDLTDPGDPTPITRFTTGLEPGVHNVWIDGDYVYAAVDDTGNGLRVVDISDPADPKVVAAYYAGTSFLHDVYVRDGLAFLSHWNAGLVILDVGNGISGGTPQSPVEVSRLQTNGGQTHNAWYWPAAGYVFVGEEDFSAPGVMHVVDASDLGSPVEVASFRVAGAPPHNFWLDEDRAILYAAWYENGLRAIDVSGALLGELDRQGREIASVLTGTGPDCPGSSGTCTWAPQLEDGLLYLSDMNDGLVVVQPNF